MEFSTLLLNLLVGSAAVIATRDSFGAGGGGAAFDALVARLEDAHDVETLPLLADARDSTGARQAILSELVDPAIARDPAVATQAEILRAELEALPEAETAPLGLGPEVLNSGRDILAAIIEGAIGRSWDPEAWDPAVEPPGSA